LGQLSPDPWARHRPLAHALRIRPAGFPINQGKPLEGWRSHWVGSLHQMGGHIRPAPQKILVSIYSALWDESGTQRDSGELLPDRVGAFLKLMQELTRILRRRIRCCPWIA
jgi:hypothetical protein